MTRVAALGFDAAEWGLVDELVKAGRMPHLASLMERGVTAQLLDTSEYRAERPWTQFVTGRSAAGSRYWSTVHFDPDTYEPYETGAHDAEPFWAIDGRKVIAFDIPHSQLSDSVDGVQVTAWGAHSPQYPRASEPAGTLTEIDAEFGTHPVFMSDTDGGFYHPQYVQGLSDAMRIGLGRRPDIMKFLAEEKLPDWELMIMVMGEPHTAGHQFWHGADETHPLYAQYGPDAYERLVAVYEQSDQVLGRMIHDLDDDVIWVAFAVHGSQTNTNDVPAMVLLPELAHRLSFGWQMLVDPYDEFDPAQHGPIIPDLDLQQVDLARQFFRHHAPEDPHAGPSFTDELWSKARRLTPIRLVAWRRKLMTMLGKGPAQPWWEMGTDIPDESTDPQGEAARPKSIEWHFPVYYQKYWRHMRWFVMPTYSDGHIRINLQGRESEGIVPLEEYDSELDRIEAFMRECTDPRTGERVVEDVIRMRIGMDPCDPDGPDSDLVIVFGTPIDSIEHPEVGTIGPVPLLRVGEHSPAGWITVAGPGVDAVSPGVHSPLDVPTTILSLLGEATDHLPGQPLVKLT
ncbi:MAG: hypothetical protein GY713_06930 [Actinomycetia bacterium]|nr:hypothetical protein [Actinomycetes bacterium]